MFESARATLQPYAGEESAPSDLIARLRLEAAMVSHYQARVYTTIAEIADLEGFDPEGLPAEVTLALTLTKAAGDSEYALALLLDRFRPVRDLLSRGVIDLRRARVIVEALAGIDKNSAGAILDRVLPFAPDLTTGQLRARVRRLTMESNPEQARMDYATGLETRRVVVEANPDGTANLLAMSLSPRSVMSIRRRLERLARRARTPGDERTADQRRADVFVDLLSGGNTVEGRNAGGVDIVVDLTTLVGLDERPGHIPGYGPVIAEIAREVVDDQVDTVWNYTVTDQGRPLATGTIHRRPTTAMKRHVRARYQTCVFPGCRMPAHQSDLDHHRPWAGGGPTTVANLAPLCRYHHNLRNHGWSYQRMPDDAIVWTSPLGHHYTTCTDPPV
ncbi:MAG: HNH endonuclease [Actinobacteria bacterium]|nr:HNH endonuclease [Actinomycetota bacterium]